MTVVKFFTPILPTCYLYRKPFHLIKRKEFLCSLKQLMALCWKTPFPEIYKKYFQIQLEERYRQIDELQGKTFDEITKFLKTGDHIDLK